MRKKDPVYWEKMYDYKITRFKRLIKEILLTVECIFALWLLTLWVDDKKSLQRFLYYKENC
jgi:hypothetical protein